MNRYQTRSATAATTSNRRMRRPFGFLRLFSITGPLASFQNEVERLESSTGGAFEFADRFVEIHLTFQLDATRVFECHLTIQHEEGRRVSAVVFPHFALVLLFARATRFGGCPQTRLCCSH